MTKWRVGIHSKRNRIWLTFPYNPKIIENLKARVPGGRWSPDEKLWHYPLDMEVARDIRAVARDFGAGLVVEPELARWAKAERARVAAIIAPDDTTVDVSHLMPRCRQQYPHLIKAMQEKPWQIPGSAFIVEQKYVLIADEPGLGKTLQTLSALVEADVQGPILVIAPRSAVGITWPEEIAQWLGPNEHVIKINTELKPAERSKAIRKVHAANSGHRTWVLCGPNYIRIRADVDQYGNYKRDRKGKKIIRAVNEAIPELFEITWSAIVVDESHQTLACSRGDKKKWSAQRLGLSALSLADGGFRIAISGTPFRGKAENMWGTLQWLKPDKFTSYWNWVRRHYGVLDNHSAFGSSIVKGDTLLDEKRFYRELRPIMIRRTKTEVAKSLPPKTYGGTHLDPQDPSSPIAVWLPLTSKQKKQYDQVTKEALIHLDSDELTVNGCLAEMVRFKQLANSCLGDGAMPVAPSNKLDWILDFLFERQEAGTKVIVASQFTKFLNMASEQAKSKGIPNYLFTGETNDKERLRIKKKFQSPEGEMVIFLNTISGGASLTLDAADDVVIVDKTWNPDDQTQVEDRAHRISRDHNVTIWSLASLATIDEDIAIINAERNDEVSLIDRQRGVSYVKALIGATRARVRETA